MESIRSDDEEEASGLGAFTLRRRAWLGIKMPPPFNLVMAPIMLAIMKKTLHMPPTHTHACAPPHTPPHTQEESQAARVHTPSLAVAV